MNKSELILWLQAEYLRWEALLDLIGASRMDQPGVNGNWSMKDMVAHLTSWNEWLVTRLQAAERNELEPAPPWPAHLKSEDEINTWIYENHHGRKVDDVLDEMERGYRQLLEAIGDLPDEVRIERINPEYYLVWIDDQRFLAGEFFNHFHDDHEPDIRTWLENIDKSR